MQLELLKPNKTLNKAYLKEKTGRAAIELFKTELTNLVSRINEQESEEHLKNVVSDFLKDTWYKGLYEINTKDRKDLVIHTGKTTKDAVGVILEVKKPKNTGEMISAAKPNAKALHELILYYLWETVDNQNTDIKYLIVTNIYEWFIFDEIWFLQNVFRNLKLRKDYDNWKLSGKDTRFFYENIAKPFLDGVTEKIECTYFDIRDYATIINNKNQDDDKKLIALYKILSPEHLLKQRFSNDSNSLDTKFYAELLYIIGLEEVKDGGKKLIRRKANPDHASLLENTLLKLKDRESLNNIPALSTFGHTADEQAYNVALELCITWINRVLFLKLLEAQLFKYHKGDKDYLFLDTNTIHDFDELSNLFFQVLAEKPENRRMDLQDKFSRVPYLNSSLFDRIPLERQTIDIGGLDNRMMLPLQTATVLKDEQGKRKTGSLTTLQYLFSFLDAYDFTSEGAEEIQEDNKNLINASVLGLIFEKINGYKDGSFFTPGFVTMYMCKETIRRAVLQKFNDAKGWNCETIETLYNKIDDKKEANTIINSLTICDPAVGSGHFLVSALNEIIAIKGELDVLMDRQGKTLRGYEVVVVNDELITTYEEELLDYNPKIKESQRVQEALFHEKQTIIENCLFGVDINPNSVKICRLRLWIELLKSAYYRTSLATFNGQRELETLPNIDINIKCGNSLISRFALDADIKSALRKSKWNIDSYKIAVQTYRDAESKEQKREMETLIDIIKKDFRSEISVNDKKIKALSKLRGDLFNLTQTKELFDDGNKKNKETKKKVENLSNEITKLETEIEEIKSNKIYDNAFEWRFEFPEVLNDDGDFIGFDVVIGNPPYIRQEEIREQKPHLQTNYETFTGTADLYVFFVEKGFALLKQAGNFCYIMPNKWMQTGYGKPLRSFLLNYQLQSIVDFGDLQVFDEATTYPCILNAAKKGTTNAFESVQVKTLKFDKGLVEYVRLNANKIDCSNLTGENWVISYGIEQVMLNKIKNNSISLFEYVKGGAHYGIKTGLTEAFVIDTATKNKLIEEDENSAKLIKPFLLGRNISPYAISKPDNWLILIPKGFTIKRNLLPDNPYYLNEPSPRYGSMPNSDAWRWFSNSYPAIANHLFSFKTKAENRTDKGDFWWELRACDYYYEFDMPKIMYQVLQVKPCFIYDDSGQYCNNSMWIIPKNDKYLVGILNSKMGWWLISKYCTAIQNGFQLIWKYFGLISIPNVEPEDKLSIEKLVNKILELKKIDTAADVTDLEKEIDKLVYALYGLTEEEIGIVEG